MSSPSPGKRRMDTDVVKLYPYQNINNTPKWPNQTSLFYNDVYLFNVDYFQHMLAALRICVMLLLAMWQYI